MLKFFEHTTVQMCNRNKEYFAKMGDINTSSKFEKYATEGSKDLNMLRVRWHNGDNIPTYRTETRTFSIVVSNFDVGINELQVDVVKALDLPGKAEIDTYIRVEVPLPSSEAPQRKKTKTVYDTINPGMAFLLFFLGNLNLNIHPPQSSTSRSSLRLTGSHAP